MHKTLSFLCAFLIAALMLISPLAYKRWQDRSSRNFHVVEEGVLYRSGQLPIPRLQKFVSYHGIKTIVCLRKGNDPIDQEEEAWVRGKSLKFVRITPRSWYRDASGEVPSEISLQAFRDVMDDPANYPVLVHCFAGIHRTGGMCAIFRMDYQAWTNEEAMAEMRLMGYTLLDDHEDVLAYMQNYQPRHTANFFPLPLRSVSRTKASP